MTLDFNLTDIKNWEEVCNIKRQPYPDEQIPDSDLDDDGCITVRKPKTTAIVFASIAVGLTSITEENASEFYARAVIFSRAFQAPFLTYQDGPYEFTPEDIRQHIGLSTNVTEETRTEWVERLFLGTVDNEPDEDGWVHDDLDVSLTTELANKYARATNAATPA